MRTLVVFLALGCQSDEGLKVYNSTPTAVITSHDEGSLFTDSIAYTFEASVSDSNHRNEELSVRWSTDQRDLCPEAQPSSDGKVSCVTELIAADTQIRLEVSDPEGAAVVDSIRIEVQETKAPNIVIHSPRTDGSYYADIPILLSATISDEEDPVSALQYLWTSSLDGELDINENPQEDGTLETFVLLGEGVHNLSLYVEDTVGKNNTETVPMTVKGPNQNPRCEIVSPADLQSYLVTQSVTFAGTATDVEDDNSTLAVSWESSLDGVIDTTPPLTDGSVGFSTDTLSPGHHTITFRVEDEVQGICDAGIQLAVGTPPVLLWDTPVDMSVASVNTDLSFFAMLTDQEDSPLDVTVEWESDIDGSFHVGTPNAAGEIEFASADLQAGVHQITVTATDSMGFVDTQTRTIRMNTPPNAPSVEITPLQPSTQDDLIAIATTPIDPDGESVSLSYLWSKNGVATALVSSTVPQTETAAGEEWTVTVTPNDGYTDGATDQAVVTIENTPPTATDIAIAATSAYNDATLSCTATFVDPDESLAPTFAWTIGTQSHTGATLDLTTTNAMPEDVVVCTATVIDAFGESASISTDVTLANREPNPITVSILPSAPVAAQDDLSCAVSGATDDDGQTVQLSYEWEQNGSITTFGTSIVPASSLTPYDTWTCIATPNDGISDGSPVSASVMIESSCVLGNCDESIYIGVGLGIDLILLNGGSFSMGSNQQEEGRESDEAQHSVTLSDDFYVATSETTQGVYLEVMGYDSRAFQSTTFGDGSDYPAYFVNWNMAAAFSNAVTDYYNTALGTNLSQCYTCSNTNTGEICSPAVDPIYRCTGYRLLTEAEWEYAARASTEESFWTSNGGGSLISGYQNASFSLTDGSDLRDYAWYTPSASNPWGAKEVATKQANGYGLFDMHGNVSEWVHDTYAAFSNESQIDPVSTSGSTHIMRGGAWNSSVQHTRAASRAEYNTSYRNFLSGFRIGRTDNADKPTAPQVSISPLSPVETVDDLVCSIDVDSIDPNGLAIDYTISWLIDGIAHTGATYTTVYPDDTIAAADTQKEEIWTCVVTPQNGNMNGYAAQATVTVASICTYSDCDSGVYLGNGIGLDFVEISGTDLIDPLSRYTLPSAFEIMTTEVTQGQFAQLMGYDAHGTMNATFGIADNYPAYNVNWHQAADFANYVTDLVNLQQGSALSNCYTCVDSGSTYVQCTESMSPDVCDGYTLPTESEWELVSRSLSSANLWTGEGSNLGGNYNSNQCVDTVLILDGASDPPLGDYAWFCGNSNNQAQPVATKTVNAFGVYDMAGSLWEWTADWYGCTYPQTDGIYCETQGTDRVRRGGGWTSTPAYLRSSYRASFDPDSGGASIGFRLRILKP